MNFVDIRGTWINEFGSVMKITTLDTATGFFSGTYQSDTGATGIYRITGITDCSPDPNVNSQALSFSVSWRSFSGSNDETRFWVSGFAGQLQIIGGRQVMTTTYLLQKNTDPDNNWGSTLVDKAVFKRISEKKLPESVNFEAAEVSGSLPSITFRMQRGAASDNGATPWFTTLGTGTPPQELKFMLDTGTDNTWVTSAACTTNACRAHTPFEAGSSSSFRMLNPQLQDKDFGPWGSMKVQIGQDVFSMNNPADKALLQTSEKMNFELAVHYTGCQFQELDADGGIAVPSPFWQESGDTQSLLLRLLSDGIIQYPVAGFGFDAAAGTGECMFGNINPALYRPETLQWLPLQDVSSTQLGYLWSIYLNNFLINGLSSGISINNFVLDTGSSCFKGPKDLIEALISAVTYGNTLPTYAVSETELSRYPTVGLSVGNQIYSLSPKQYFIQMNENYWELGIQVLEGMPEGMLLVGSVFLDTVYSVYDFKTAQIGLALPS